MSQPQLGEKWERQVTFWRSLGVGRRWRGVWAWGKSLYCRKGDLWGGVRNHWLRIPKTPGDVLWREGWAVGRGGLSSPLQREVRGWARAQHRWWVVGQSWGRGSSYFLLSLPSVALLKEDLAILGIERGRELAAFWSRRWKVWDITLEKGTDFSNRFNRHLSTWFLHKHFI